MSDNPTPTPTPEPGKEPDKEQTFTQAEVDRIVTERLKREREATKTKYADYDDLKEKAGKSTTLEERVADIERQAKDSEARAMRAEIANAKGLTPSQAKRLVGETREELEADATELLADIGAQKKNGNHVPREGNNPPPAGSDESREFTRQLFNRANSD
jgi:cell division septum initiation protein DivIVA